MLCRASRHRTSNISIYVLPLPTACSHPERRQLQRSFVMPTPLSGRDQLQSTNHPTSDYLGGCHASPGQIQGSVTPRNMIKPWGEWE